MLALGVGSAGAFAFLSYRLFIRPALRVKAERDSPPPEEGWRKEILIDEADRQRRFSIGQLDSDIKLRLAGIKEDQLILQFRKDRGLEEYEITVSPGPNVFYRAPHARKIEPIRSSEVFQSRELIGNNAMFRVAASVKDNRPLQYVEFLLTSRYIISNLGQERMQFELEISRIFPSLDEKSRDKKGIFSFGRFKQEADEE